MHDHPTTVPDYALFLAQQLPLQQANIAPYHLAGEQLWIKRAGPRHGMAPYRALGALARVLRLPVLRPVPNLGGTAAIAIEVRRLRQLHDAGLRVPTVLAACEQGFAMRHLAPDGQGAPTLADVIEQAIGEGAQAVLAQWQRGLQLLDAVHGRGQCLSQAFARNMVCCPDGMLACIDFEDDPAAALPLALCQLRDALAYVHSTALYLHEAQAFAGARALWRQWLAQPLRGPDFDAALAQTLTRLRWLRHLPADRRWGRDTQRLRAAHDLLLGPAM